MGFANNACRRFKRAQGWLAADKQDEKKVKVQTAECAMKLAKAQALAYQRFGPESDKKASDEEKKALGDARELLAKVLKTSEELNMEQLKYDCLKSDSARLNRLNTAKELQEGAGTVKTLQLEL